MAAEAVSFTWRDLTLVGDLRLPDGPSPHPLVVMMQGSGPSDRSSNGYFPEIQEAFLARGMATYAFDKPGCGESSGDWRDFNLGDRASQVEGAIAMLRDLALIDPRRVGVWGQSQGGWMAQILARRADLSFAIANSGPTIAMPEQDLFGFEHSLRADGIPEDIIGSVLDFVASVHQAARDGLSHPELIERVLDPVRDQLWYQMVPLDEPAEYRLTAGFVTEDYQPLTALRGARCPYLAIYGGRDVLVPAWSGAAETARALGQSESPDYRVVVFPEGSHRIQDDAESFVPGYLEFLGDWAAERMRV